jgi:hypothetical protein
MEMETVPKRNLLPSPITATAFGLALLVYVVFVSYVASMPPPPIKNDFVDNDVATRLVRTLFRVHERTVNAITIVDVDPFGAIDADSAPSAAEVDPEIALEDFAAPPQDQIPTLEDQLGSLP